VEITTDDFAHEFVVRPAAAGYYRLEVIQPPEDDLEKEPSVLMVDALTNPIYVRLAERQDADKRGCPDTLH